MQELKARVCEHCGQGLVPRRGAINAYTIDGKRGYWHVTCARKVLVKLAKGKATGDSK